jgi:hypothetical protein
MDAQSLQAGHFRPHKIPLLMIFGILQWYITDVHPRTTLDVFETADV